MKLAGRTMSPGNQAVMVRPAIPHGQPTLPGIVHLRPPVRDCWEVSREMVAACSLRDHVVPMRSLPTHGRRTSGMSMLPSACW